MMVEQNKRRKWILFSFFVAVFLLVGKTWIANVTGSMALKSDALESWVNVIAALVGYFCIRIADEPADREHPYGHGKVEYISAIMEGAMMLMAAVWIVSEAWERFHSEQIYEKMDLGILVSLGLGLVNGVLGILLVRSGKKYSSPALTADGKHVLSDFYTTLGVTFGLWISLRLNEPRLDLWIALLVSLLLVFSALRVIRNSFQSLIDREDQNLIEEIVKLYNDKKPNGIISMHGLRTLRSGRTVHVDAHLVVGEYLSVDVAHRFVDDAGDMILKTLDLSGEIHAHLDPCEKKYCTTCEDLSCPIRMAPLQSVKPLSVKEATRLPETHQHKI